MVCHVVWCDGMGWDGLVGGFGWFGGGLGWVCWFVNWYRWAGLGWVWLGLVWWVDLRVCTGSGLVRVWFGLGWVGWLAPECACALGQPVPRTGTLGTGLFGTGSFRCVSCGLVVGAWWWRGGGSAGGLVGAVEFGAWWAGGRAGWGGGVGSANISASSYLTARV